MHAFLAVLPVLATVQEIPYDDTAALLVQAIERGDWALVVVAGLVLATFARVSCWCRCCPSFAPTWAGFFSPWWG